MNEPAPLVKKTAPLWAHVLAYWVFYFAVGGLLTAVGVTLATRSTDRQVEGVWWVVFCSMLLVALVICMWPSFLFLKRDIRQLIRRRGGRVLSERGRNLDATIGALRMVTHIDRPVLDYWPTPRANLLRMARGRPGLYGGFHPRYMYRLSRVDLIWFAELASVADTDVRVRVADHRPIIEAASGVDVVDRALQAASDSLTEEGLELTFKVRRYGIHVTIVGGTWEGGKFQARLIQTIDGVERAAVALGRTYRASDPASPNVARVDDEVVIR